MAVIYSNTNYILMQKRYYFSLQSYERGVTLLIFEAVNRVPGRLSLSEVLTGRCLLCPPQSHYESPWVTKVPFLLMNLHVISFRSALLVIHLIYVHLTCFFHQLQTFMTCFCLSLTICFSTNALAVKSTCYCLPLYYSVHFAHLHIHSLCSRLFLGPAVD